MHWCLPQSEISTWDWGFFLFVCWKYNQDFIEKGTSKSASVSFSHRKDRFMYFEVLFVFFLKDPRAIVFWLKNRNYWLLAGIWAWDREYSANRNKSGEGICLKRTENCIDEQWEGTGCLTYLWAFKKFVLKAKINLSAFNIFKLMFSMLEH